MNRKWTKVISSLLFLVMLSGCASSGANPPSASPDATPEDTGIPSTGQLDFLLIGADGNNNAYDKKQASPVEDSPLKGKTIYWLGSSVTYGSGSNGQSMAHFLEVTDGVTCVVEAMSGTTLATQDEDGDKSYISRMLNSEKFFVDEKIDLFVCQVSTNDCKDKNIAFLGELTSDDTMELDSFDLSTAAGSIEYLIRYVHDTWNCPIYFYSGAFFGDEGTGVRAKDDPSGSNYEKLVNLTLSAVEKWDTKDGYSVNVIDLYHDGDFNDLISDSDYEYLMRDAIHPRKAGYLVWWLPKFQEVFYQEFS